MFDRTSGGRSDLDRVSRLVENSRFAVDVIGDDMRHAGFYGTFLPPSDTIFTDTSPCAWNVADIDSARVAADSGATALSGAVDGLGRPRSRGILRWVACPIACQEPTSSWCVVSALTAVAAAAVNVRNIYVQASQCINDPALLRVSNLAAQFNLRTAACDPAVLAQIRRYFVRGYYVASCNNCTPSDGIPTLKRVEIIDNAVRVVSLAEGVINMQVEYAFDTNDDGSPEQYLTSTTAGGNADIFLVERRCRALAYADAKH